MGFWKNMMKTPAERFHDKLSGVMQNMDDGAMIPEVRAAINEGKFASIELTNGGQESGILILNKGELCLFFAIAAQVKQAKRLSGFINNGISYDALLSYRNRCVSSGMSQAVYQMEFTATTGFLALTDKRMLFLPQSDGMSNSKPIEVKIEKILSVRTVDRFLLVVQSGKNIYNFYTKYPKMFEMVLMNARKCDRIEESKDIKHLSI